jgi:hypothetical protein
VNEDPLSPAARDLLAAHVGSVTTLDVLLLMHRDGRRLWTASEVAAELRIGADWAEEQLILLVRGSLVSRSAAGYAYAPQQPDAARAVDELARAYRTHPVSVVAAIYSKPDRRLQSFADAFRLRKDPADTHGEGGRTDG